MKRLKNYMIVVVLLSAPFLNAEPVAKIMFQNGAIRELSDLTVNAGTIFLPKDQIAVSISTVQRMDFSFSMLSNEMCEELLGKADFEGLYTTLDSALASLHPFLAISSNLDPFLFLQLKAQFWTEKYDETLRQVEMLHQRRSPFYQKAQMYQVLALIEQKKEAEARKQFEAIVNAGSLSPVMTEMIRGRFAMIDERYSEALQHFSNIIVEYDRDREWVPSATWFEGLVYKKTGYLVSALNISEELILAYPRTIWSQRAVELKK